MQTKTLLSTALVVSAAYAQTTNSTLTSVLASNSNLTSLTGILAMYPAVAASLANATNITLFAPSNEAFQTLNTSGALMTAAGMDGVVQALLSYHVHAGIVYASDITSSPNFLHTTLTNTTYSNVTGGQVIEARLTGTTAEIVSGLKSVSNVTQANVNFTGGVIHIIDSVLTVPTNVTAVSTAANLTAYLGAIDVAGLNTTLDTASDITIFAPSNSAFQNIASGLTNVSAADLKSILSYHVLNGTVAYSSMLSNATLMTSGGGNLTITIANGTVFVNSARVINSDILISGGVLHIIDAVLNPNNTVATTNGTGSTPVSAYSGASSEATVPYTAGIATPTSVVTALVTTTEQVVASYTPTGGATAAKSSSTSKAGAAAPTGAMGAAALFGGAAFLANL